MSETDKKSVDKESKLALIPQALQAHGVEATSQGVLGLAAAGDDATLHDVFREAGFTREDFSAITTALHPDVSPAKLTSVGVAAGAGIAIAAIPVSQLLKEGRTSWQAFVKTAPKIATFGAVLGGVTGVATAMITNLRRRELRAQGTAYFDKQDATGAEGQGFKNPSAPRR